MLKVAASLTVQLRVEAAPDAIVTGDAAKALIVGGGG
jgi:hypothetical protein